jgi:hypothetical protein
MSGEQSISVERSRLGKKLGEGVEREEKKGEGSEVMGEGRGGGVSLLAAMQSAEATSFRSSLCSASTCSSSFMAVSLSSSSP